LYAVRGKNVAFSDSFYSELYCNFNTWQMMLVFRGTKNFGNIFTDIYNVVLGLNGGELDCAFTFGEKVRRLLLEFKGRMQLLITGHSLGGYIAQMITYTIKNVCIRNGKAVRYTNKSFPIHPHTEVFDAPPCYSRLVHISQENPVSIDSVWLDITNYVICPNLVNGLKLLGFHLGQVICLSFPGDIERNPSTWSLVKNTSMHSLKNFEGIDTKNYSKVVDFLNMETTPYEENVIPWFSFAKSELECLKNLTFLRAMDRQEFGELGDFKINDGSIHLQRGQNVRNFLPKARKFVRNKYAILMNAEDIIQSRFLDRSERMNVINRVEVDGVTTKIDDRTLESIAEWPSRTILNGFSPKEQPILGKLLYNSVPNTHFIHKSVFNEMSNEEKESFLNSFNGTLVILLEEEGIFNPEHGRFRQIAIASNATFAESDTQEIEVKFLQFDQLRKLRNIIFREKGRIDKENEPPKSRKRAKYKIRKRRNKDFIKAKQILRNFPSVALVSGLSQQEQEILVRIMEHENKNEYFVILKLIFDAMDSREKADFLNKLEKKTLVFLLGDDESEFAPVSYRERQIALSLNAVPKRHPEERIVQRQELQGLQPQLDFEKCRIRQAALNSVILASGKETMQNVSYKLDKIDASVIRENWPNRVIANGLDSNEQTLFAQLLHNSVPKTNFVHKSVLDNMEPAIREGILQSFDGNLAIMLEEEKEFVPIDGNFRQIAFALDAHPCDTERESTLVVNKSELGECFQRQNFLFKKTLESESEYDSNKFEGVNLLAYLAEHNTGVIERKRSSRSKVYIKQFLQTSDQAGVPYSVPADRFTDILLDSSLKAAGIVGMSGSGKSTILEMLAEQMNTKLSEHCIVQVDLKKSRKFYGRRENGRNCDLIDFLSSWMIGVPKDQILMCYENKRIIILLDGYESLSFGHKQWANQIIEMIISSGLFFLFTLKPHQRYSLWPLLNDINWQGFSILPLREDRKLNVITSTWLYLQGGTTLDMEDTKRAKYVLDTYIIDETCVGAMVQLQLLAHATCNEYSPPITSLDTLLRTITEQCLISGLDQSEPDTREFESFRKELYKFAIAEVLSEGRISIPESEDHAKMMMNPELVHINTTGSLTEVSFLHSTLAEYLFAECVVCLILSNGSIMEEKVQIFWELENIFLAEHFRNVRFFMNRILIKQLRGSTNSSMSQIQELECFSHEIFILLLEENLPRIYSMLKVKLRFSLNKRMCNNRIKPLLYAIKYCDKDFVQELYTDGARLNIADLTTQPWILHSALQKGLDQFVREHYTDIRDWLNKPQELDLQTPFYIAVRTGNISMALFLLEKGADPHFSDSNHWTPLHVAVMNKDHAMVKLLLETVQNLKVNLQCRLGRTALHFAVLNNDIKMVEILLQRDDLDLTISSKEGRNPLLLANLMEVSESIVMKLLSKDPIYGQELRSGVPWIHSAARFGHVHFLKILSKTSDNVNEATDNGWTALHFAAFSGSLEATKFLVFKKKADLNLQTRDDRRTPLMIAAARGSIDVVKFLVSKVNADITLCDTSMKTARMLAEENGHAEIVQYLM
jgi:ankyrin repeat protein